MTESIAILSSQNKSPVLSLDFTNGADSRFGVSRAAGGATYFDQTGTLQLAAANTQRIDYGWLGGKTLNYVHNSSASGASVGVGPTNWSGNNVTSNGVTSTVVNTGTDAGTGLPYVDYRFAGTATGTFFVMTFDPFNVTTAVPNDVWTESVYVALVGGSLTNITSISVDLRTQNGLYDFVFTPTSTLTRYRSTFAATTTNMSLGGGITPGFAINFTNGTAVDITLRFAGPQLERSSFPTPLVQTFGLPTSGNGVTNYIRNSSGVGAVPGSPGTLPTNWTIAIGSGLSYSVVGTGVESGIPYTDIRLFGTATATANKFIQLEPGSISAAIGQTWCLSSYFRLVAGSFANLNFMTLQNEEHDSGGSLVGSATIDIRGTTSAPLSGQRFSVVRTNTSEATQFQYPTIVWGFSINAVIDFTLRIGNPQLELNCASPSAMIQTSGSVVSTGCVALGLLSEETRTNSIRNPRAEGAVAGTPGTLPADWDNGGNTAGLTQTVVGSGVENGIPYVDVQFSGTSTGTAITLDFEGTTVIAALTGQVWSISAFLRLVAGSFANITNISLIEQEYTSGGAFVVAQVSPNITPGSGPLASQRFSYTGTLSGGATTAFVMPYIKLTFAVSAAINFTLRIGAPQLELGGLYPGATTPILPPAGTPAATTRANDAPLPLNAGPLWNGAASTLSIEAIPLNTAGGNPGGLIRFDDDANGNNRFQLALVALSNAVNSYVQTGGVSSISNADQHALTFGAVFKYAGSLRRGYYHSCFNGGSVFSSTAAIMPNNITELRVGVGAGSLAAPGAYIRKAIVWKRILTDGELQAITT